MDTLYIGFTPSCPPHILQQICSYDFYCFAAILGHSFLQLNAQKNILTNVELDTYRDVLARPICSLSLLA